MNQSLRRAALFIFVLIATASYATERTGKATTSRTAEIEGVIDKEKAVWQTVQDKKYNAFRKNLADDCRSVYSDGIKTVDQEVASVRKADLKSFSLSDVNVAFPDKDTALLTYKVTTQGTQEGKDTSGSYNAASVWHKHGSDWRAIFHTEVKAE